MEGLLTSAEVTQWGVPYPASGWRFMLTSQAHNGRAALRPMEASEHTNSLLKFQSPIF